MNQLVQRVVQTRLKSNIHGVARMQEITDVVMRRKIKENFRGQLVPVYFLTSAHLVNNCVKWTCLLKFSVSEMYKTVQNNLNSRSPYSLILEFELILFCHLLLPTAERIVQFSSTHIFIVVSLFWSLLLVVFLS